VARRTGDVFSLTSSTRPADLLTLLEVARGRRLVVELGTGTAWTAISLALDDPRREVISYDPVAPPERARYLALVRPAVRSQIRLIQASGASGPPDDRGAEMLYIDSSHQREDTLAELAAWRPALGAGALIVFDDYDHPDFPGVRAAVEQLGLPGTARGTLFVHQIEDALRAA
jgi:hypothetical protein